MEKSTGDPQPIGVCSILSDYADHASMNGVIFVKSAKSVKVKLMWSVLVLVAFGAMTFHLYTLIGRYLQYEKHSDLDLGFSSLEFPAVSICNTNIMKYSKMKEGAQDIAQLVSSIISSKNQLLQNEQPEIPYYSQSEPPAVDQQSPEVVETQNSSSLVSNDNSSSLVSNDNSSSLVSNDNSTSQNILTSGIDPEDEISFLGDPVYWDIDDERSTIAQLMMEFKVKFSQLSRTQQQALGHQLKDLLLQCSFATWKCSMNYSVFTTTDYGNCYTIQEKSFVSRKSGPTAGLELILYLEPDEYVPILTSSTGAQIVIHDLNSVPLPDDEGISIPAGQETMIGLKQVKISRLGDPYGPCKPVDAFMLKYNIAYTKKLCQKMCLLQQILDKCQCADAYFKYIYVIMTSTQLIYCSTKPESQCVDQVQLEFNGDDERCGCFEPCSETVYERTMSFRQWPNKPLAELVIDKVCASSPQSCKILMNKTAPEVSGSFLKLNIFYQDLNYEMLQESPNYEFTQLLSDIGGTIGLWIGLSVLSLFELVHLIIDLGYYALFDKASKNTVEVLKTR